MERTNTEEVSRSELMEAQEFEELILEELERDDAEIYMFVKRT